MWLIKQAAASDDLLQYPITRGGLALILGEHLCKHI